MIIFCYRSCQSLLKKKLYAKNVNGTKTQAAFSLLLTGMNSESIIAAVNQTIHNADHENFQSFGENSASSYVQTTSLVGPVNTTSKDESIVNATAPATIDASSKPSSTTATTGEAPFKLVHQTVSLSTTAKSPAITLTTLLLCFISF